MLEQGLQSVQRTVKQASTAYPDARESASAYEAIEARRENNREASESRHKSFQIEKQFSTSSKELARTLGSFHKILEVLERPEDSESERPSSPVPQKELFGTQLPPLLNKQSGTRSQPQHQSGSAYEEVQLEFDFKLDDGKQTLPKAPLDFDLGLKRFSSFDDEPDINIGINPSKFKIQNIITDEIIKAISSSNNEIEIDNLGEPVATKLANHVRKLLEKQPHALATTKESAPVKVFETLI